jgi:hypothetical protein
MKLKKFPHELIFDKVEVNWKEVFASIRFHICLRPQQGQK